MEAQRALLAALVACAVSACLDRPVSTSEPNTMNLSIREIETRRVDKIDLLFMVDNSQSMADKQKILRLAVPELLDRLITPDCLDSAGVARGRANAAGECSPGLDPEFAPVRDIHIGVISSSLGDLGAGSCPGAEGNDHGQLIGARRPNNTPALSSYQGLGFLAWDPDAKHQPPGQSDATQLKQDFANLVVASGEAGCGFEASLESWYRFLIDPSPPAQIVNQGSRLVAEGIDETLLAQRRAFLRPDSLVGIVMLSDENDCSIRPENSNWVVTDTQSPMYRATAACDSDPNAACCRSCEQPPQPGCPSNAQDPSCSKGERLTPEVEDSPFVRCYDQKRRYGVDFLQPTARYVDGLKQKLVPDRDGNLVRNPLYPPGGRDDSRLVFLAGVIGVPWQDIADDASRDDPARLRYLSAAELAATDRYSQILADPLMRESVEPRTGEHPFLGRNYGIQPPDAALLANPANGHEKQNPALSDLQYSCIFPLATPVDCSTIGSGQACDCGSQADIDNKDPLCQAPDGSYGHTQYFAKAYPPRRQLEVLRDYGESSIVASICPKIGDSANPDYGYNPAVDAIIDRIKQTFQGTCLARPLPRDPVSGAVPCAVVESVSPVDLQAQGASCDCGTPGRAPVDPSVKPLVMRRLRERGACDAQGSPACADYCLCELTGLEGDAQERCKTLEDASAAGYCYVDAAPGEPGFEFVKSCGPSERRVLRYVSDDPELNPIPRNGASVLAACLGAAF